MGGFGKRGIPGPSMWLCVTLATCFLLVLHGGFAESEVDSDLVFDNLEDVRTSRHQRDVPNSPLRVESSQAVEEEHWFSGTLHRIKRHIGNLFNSFHSEGDTAKRKTKRQDDFGAREDDYEAQNEIDEDTLSFESPTYKQAYNNDDEDLKDNSGEGSTPEQPTPIVPHFPQPSGHAFYRISFILNEPYLADFDDKNSEAYRRVTRSIVDEINKLYEDLPGVHTASVIGIEKKDDLFTSKVTVDLASVGYGNEEIIRNRIFSHIQQNQRLGDHLVSPEGFNFRRFSDEQCQSDQLKCRSGECVAATGRCDGRLDCADGTDEENCDHTTSSSGVFTDEGSGDIIDHTEKPFEEVPPNGHGPVIGSTFNATSSRCRADDMVRCSDGSNYICEDQKCDGIPDCPDGDDEAGCSPFDCASSEFMCDISRCIPKNQRCNGVNDCEDRTDEENCGECSSDQFRCDRNKCVDNSKKCDGRPDCSDGTDEQDCFVSQCVPPYEHPCDASRRFCFSQSQRCDGRTDCPNGYDERDCGTTRCNSEREFTCGNGRCIPLTSRCDRKNDCEDNSDERNCPCLPTDFKCQNGYCIPPSMRCDGIRHCQDGSDEIGCSSTCAAYQWRCHDGTCIDQTLKCNYRPDCPDHSDEINCERCKQDEFRCNDGSCLSISKRCDGMGDCPFSEDEESCVVCKEDQFRCTNAECIPQSQKCNGHSDCSDGSDERDCYACDEKDFQCRISKECISKGLICDGYADCSDKSDEEGCSKCSTEEFRCVSDGSCIPDGLTCNGQRDCPDGSDESDCPPVKVCGSQEHTCGDGTCIPSYLVCNGRNDCRDGSDEQVCACRPDEFQCLNGRCIDSRYRCDRRSDCSDGSDEANCPPIPTPPPTERPPPYQPECPRGQTHCATGGQCIRFNQFCDGRIDCNDLSDETRCPGSTDGLNLRTYPSQQDIKENREVVFQCRDEGPLRAKVHWVRGNGLALPPGSKDVNGRLEMPNIKVEHSGTYTCEAIGYPPGTPGSQVSVHLQVDPYIPPPTRPPTACALHEATCSNGDCIPKHFVCDGKFDCTDGSDENRCNLHGCEPNEFRCSNKRCVLKTWRCDSDDDCGDGSDEANCATNPPGSPCAYNQYACQSNNQCVPRAFHCDGQNDCVDGSDEIGCSKSVIVKPPLPMVNLNVGELFVMTCTAVAIPPPEIVWRLNWGHVPEKCNSVSQAGTGTLTCPDIQIADQGAYSCEAINIKGSVFAVPDTILFVTGSQQNVCPRGYFNEAARDPNECIPCFCFGQSTECRSADLFIYEFKPPFDSYKYVGVRIDPVSGVVDIRDEPIYRGAQPRLVPIGRNGVHAQLSAPRGELAQPNVIPYFALPENYHGNQLKSYGGYLRYTIRYEGLGRPITSPDVILTGNGYTLLHIGQRPEAGREEEFRVQLFAGEWVKRSETAPETPATREEIMMALASIDNILIKLQYVDGHLDTTLSSIEMDSAATPNSGLGEASYVEECRCPVGYSGLSCENCAEGYIRHRSGPWLGQCQKVPDICPAGTYGDPNRGCELCPCPLTNPRNQFGHTCSLAPDGQVTCDCPPGYVGRRCEQCAVGYTGNPLVPGDTCRPGVCSAEGSASLTADIQGRCQCKDNTYGPACDQCKPNTFYLSADNQFGCIACFCMGITNQCKSSYWYRDKVSVSFTNSINDFKLVELKNRETPIQQGIRIDQNAREIVYSNFSNTSPEVFYWVLPSPFLGDKVISYGGYLRYTVRYTPAPGGQSSRNVAPDVELVSKNRISLLYFGRDQPLANTPQTIAVPLFEQYWERADGKQADREHLLMALADLEAIYIKATYTTNTREVALVSVSLDTANERNTGSLERAQAVEQCSCPPGYKGLSCEDCDYGYTRSEDGLYLGLCLPCECNGKSNECDPETGVCYNCREDTTGEHCEQCRPGYTGDPTSGIPCRLEAGPQCECDPRGTIYGECDRGVCPCKANVEGSRCDRCRPGTFGLNSSRLEGCQTCFCSGVSNECTESNLYIEIIPMNIIEAESSFSLTDRNQQQRITNGFLTNILMNEIGYVFRPSSVSQWYWSLPQNFIGPKLLSYGGRLEFTQRYTQRLGATYTPDQDVIITGNGVTLYWRNPQSQQPEIANKISVLLSTEGNWQRLEYHQGSRPATREDILIVLANIEAILIRAQLSTDTQSSYLSDITLETALDTPTDHRRAVDVEICRCPPGYRGTSCELCAPGYYRDVKDTTTGPLGSCTRCPCSGNEHSCNLGPDNRVKCHCLPSYTGSACDIHVGVTTEQPFPSPIPPIPPQITVTITPSAAIEIYEVGSDVKLYCSARSTSPQPVSIHWTKEGGVLPDRAVDDSRGYLLITDLRISDSGKYLCQVTDGTTFVVEQYVLNVGGNAPEIPRVSISPGYLDVSVGDPIEIRCQASGRPEPSLTFRRQDGLPVNPTHSFSQGDFYIPQALISDSGLYQCIATNEVGTDSSSINVNVRQPSGVLQHVLISPPYFSGTTGDEIVLKCEGEGPLRSVSWSKSGGELPYNAREENGVLTVSDSKVEDSGLFICTIVNYAGAVGYGNATVSITGRGGIYPVVKVIPEKITISQGSSTELRCEASGVPPPTIKWTKLDAAGNEKNIEQVGQILYIRNAQVNDRGVYICVANNGHGLAQGSSIVEVNRLEAPSIQIYPTESQTVKVGQGVYLQCRVTAGIPEPTIEWLGPNSRPLNPNIEQLAGGALRFTQTSLADAGAYTCTATNEAGRVTAVGTLIVQTDPEVTIVPNRDVLTVREGDPVKIVCKATGIPQPTVQWIKPDDSYVIRGQEIPQSYPPSYDAVVEILHATTQHAGVYTCRASSSAGTREKQIHITVDTYPVRGDITGEDAGAGGEIDNDIVPYPPTGGYKQIGHLPPNILDKDISAPIGTRAELRCRVENEQNDIYVNWRRADNSSLPEGAHIFSGILYIDSVQPEAAGSYVCYGVNRYGQVVFNFNTHLTVTTPPHITLSPSRQVVRPGTDAYIHCSASGDQPITIDWTAVGRPMPTTAEVSDGYITFHRIKESDQGRYRCRAVNLAGEADGVAEVVVQENSGRPTVVATTHEMEAPLNSNITLHCRAQNTNIRPEVRWYRERAILPLSAVVDGEYLHLYYVQYNDGGRYYCEIPSGEEVNADYINLSIIGPHATSPASINAPDLIITASKDALRIGDSVDVTCQSSEPGVIAAWSRPAGRFATNVVTSGGRLRIYAVKPENAGIYRCEATGNRGLYHKDYTLDLVDSSEDIQGEQPIEVINEQQGKDVSFKCNTDLSGQITYQWKKQDADLPDYVNTNSQFIQLNDISAKDAGTYICTASNDQTSIDYPKVLVVTGIVPYFAQAPISYLALPTLPDSYMHFSFEISFKPERGDGLILYNGHKGSTRNNDFISLRLDNGIPEFRYNLGQGVTKLLANRSLSLGKWHTIKVVRNRRKAMMYVDGQGPYTVVADGKLIGLDLSEPLYLGGVPDFDDIAPEAEAEIGFVGCISRLKIGDTFQNILNEATSKEGITTCETCSDNPCHNQGVCQEAMSTDGYTCICPSRYGGPTCSKLKGEACSPYSCGPGKCVDTAIGFKCYCPFGRAGPRCEREILINEPAFSDEAYVAYQPPKQYKRLKIAMKVKPSDVSDGILLYAGETEEGDGEFASLAIRNRHIEFRFDNGTGTTVIRSPNEVLPDKWVVISATRSTNEGQLVVNGDPPVTAWGTGSKALSLHTPLYVGGYDKIRIKVNKGVGVKKGFNGCINQLSVYGLSLSLVNSVAESANVEDCSNIYGAEPEKNEVLSKYEALTTPQVYQATACASSPCRNEGACFPIRPGVYRCDCINGFSGHDCEIPPNLCEQLKPCQNGGTCRGNTSQYECDCNLGYAGTNCEQRVDIRNNAHFSGNGYLEFSKSMLPHRIEDLEETIALELSTNSSQGLIFWHGQKPNEDGQGQDYIYLAIVNGYLEFGYDLGSGPAIIHNGKIRINDGERHSVILKRRGKVGSIEIDNTYYEAGEAEGFTNTLNTAGNIYLGGTPNIALMTGLKFTQGFNGCIHGFELQDSRRIDLGTKAINGLNVKPCYSSNDIWDDDDGDNLIN